MEQNIVRYIVVTGAIVLCLTGIFSCMRDTAKSATDTDISGTVQQVEIDIRTAGDEVATARTELELGQESLSRATDRVGQLQQSADDRTTLIRESRELLATGRSIFDDIDRENQLNRTQIGSQE